MKAMGFAGALFAVAMVVGAVFYPGNAMSQKRNITFNSGCLAGMYYHLGSAITKVVHDKYGDIQVNLQPVVSSIINSKMIGAGEADIGTVQNDIAYYALKGIKPFFNKPVTNIRGIASLYSETVQIQARKDANIATVKDLKGKRVAVGPHGTMPVETSLQVLEAYGLAFKDLGKVEYMTINEAANALKANQIDALFFLGAVGYPSMSGTASQTDTVIVPIDDERVALLMGKYSYYVKSKIPAGIYKGVGADVPTLDVYTMLAASAELDNDTAYRVTKAIFENIKTIAPSHAVGKQIKLETALAGMPIPVHPGAEKYYKEVGQIK